jgi:hypothetical protein
MSASGSAPVGLLFCPTAVGQLSGVSFDALSRGWQSSGGKRSDGLQGDPVDNRHSAIAATVAPLLPFASCRRTPAKLLRWLFRLSGSTRVIAKLGTQD